MIVVGFIMMSGIWMPFVPAAEVQYVQYGSTVTLNCKIFYIYDTTWLRNNPDSTPTVILSASLTEAQPVQGFQLNFRFSLEIMNRSLALKITNIEEGDLGLYYCIANVETALTVGRGTTLQVSSQGSSWSFFQHSMVVGFVLLVMVLAVCITHWKANFNRENTN
ncbi:hypothetical protein CgunFtcFv8_022614 [Champsocephalus gunnari]|uniref:Ig-like domain-containing protein n=1 Tax=Champsocephalus gunnari TaxID=52237 RepID=A0AAN8DR81_CHAGU|nr:hypothetical protein CgunFtcFv8_022614 [Champsocephalus gunnari]